MTNYFREIDMDPFRAIKACIRKMLSLVCRKDNSHRRGATITSNSFTNCMVTKHFYGEWFMDFQITI